jgi:alpha-L-fucosidase
MARLWRLRGATMRQLAIVTFSVLGFTMSASAKEQEDRLQWWREARFGMFIHWGPVSLKGTEISWSRGGERRGIQGKGAIPVEEYDNLYKQFNPVQFNADDWVSIARSAGMKYMVLTAKHCDGFCLWHSGVDDYTIGNTPFKRDVCGELASAAQKSNMKIGWYYSPMDWRDPDCRTERNDIYVKRMQGHLRELLGNYGRIDLLWFDTDGGPAPWDQVKTYALVRSLQPRLVINNRLGMGSMEDYRAQKIDPMADYMTPEQRVGAFDKERPWETCMTLGTQWSWKPDDKIKSYGECIRILVQCASGDGNLLLNVGPMPNGEIEPRQVTVLKEIGAWLARYGESIYGTRGGPFRNGGWGGSTHKGNIVYLHIMKWDNNQLALPALAATIKNSQALTGGDVRVEQTSDGIIVRMPADQQGKVSTLVRLELDRPVDQMQPLEVRRRITVDMEKVSIALVTPPDLKFSAQGVKSLVDGVRGTTDRMAGEWLGFEGNDFEASFDFRAARRVSRIVVGCLQEQVSWIFYPKTVEISVSDNGAEFRPVAKIETGEPKEDAEIRSNDFSVSFDPVVARYLRIRAMNVGVCPTWHEGAGRKAWVLIDEIGVE